jgi:hypothetical protein
VSSCGRRIGGVAERARTTGAARPGGEYHLPPATATV